DVILVDDNYATIIVAVSLGRNIYDNIKKVVQYLLSSNIGEVFTIFVASLLSVLFPQYRLGVPLFAMHLLWVNLITDSLPAFALGIVDIDDDLMKLPPRNKNESFFVHGLGRAIIWQGLMIGTLTLTAYLIGHTADPNTYLGQTMAFMTLSTTQLFHAFNMKSKHSIFNKRLFSNKYLLIAFFVGILLQIGICYIRPLSQVFKVVPMDFNYLLICFALSLVPIIIIEFVKAFRDSKISQQ
ncbi:MAG: cation transporting ATPase C-terminal domain-containing protein, partial [Bacilli bacterium]